MSDYTDHIVHDHNHDGIDRRGFLKCMAWAGTGLLCSIDGGILSSRVFGQESTREGTSDLTFVQVSDSHIGFDKPANHDVIGTFQTAVDRINALPDRPAFILHTGDLTQLAQSDQFDHVDQILKDAHTQTGQVFYVPGEHDVVGDGGKLYRDRYGKGTKGDGWYSFDIEGIHFIGLVNVLDIGTGGLGSLGEDQLAWLSDDLRAVRNETPVVVFAHIPLWAVYPTWGWGTADGARALSMLRRFGSVTVLNGHIHQVQQKIEGNVTFHTAMSTAFPQPAPGTAEKPGPMVVPVGQLRHTLGVTDVHYIQGSHSLALVDQPLESISAGDAS